MSDTVILAIIAVLSPVVTGSFLFFSNRSNKREDWKRQDAVALRVLEVAKKVDTASVVMTAANQERMATLDRINSTTEATHVLVNNGNTEQLRWFAVLLRGFANDHPDDPVLAAAASDAEDKLARNVAANAEAAAKLGTSSAPLKVVVVNAEPVPVDQVEKGPHE